MPLGDATRLPLLQRFETGFDLGAARL